MKNIKLMQLEANKCRCLCRKCHTKESSKKLKEKKENFIYSKQNKAIIKLNNVNRNKDYVDSIKISIGKCNNINCNDIFDNNNLMFYEFNHINYIDKYKTINKMVYDGNSIEKIKLEITKCELLCSYCHYDYTITQRNNIKYIVQYKIIKQKVLTDLLLKLNNI